MAFLIVRAVDVPARMSIDLTGRPAELAPLRRRLRKWLALRGLSEQEREDAVLSISEAGNNAIEHGYGGRSGSIRLVVVHSEGELEIVMEDRGTWRPPVADPERGRGLEIMRALMQEASIEHEPGCTRVLPGQRLADPSATRLRRALSGGNLLAGKRHHERSKSSGSGLVVRAQRRPHTYPFRSWRPDWSNGGIGCSVARGGPAPADSGVPVTKWWSDWARRGLVEPRSAIWEVA